MRRPAATLRQAGPRGTGRRGRERELACRPGRSAVPAALAWSLLIPFTAAAVADALHPGSDAPACGALRPGATAACPARAADPPGTVATPFPGVTARSPAPPPGERREAPVRAELPIDRGIERDIDDFLLQYGKPPRSAVRALLDPSDENIAALRAEQARRETVAAYVAQRLTEIQERPELAESSDPAALDAARRAVPFLAALRITVLVPADCASCAPLFRTLRQFGRANPVADLRLAVVGADGAAQVLGQLRDADLPVPVTVLSPDAARAFGFPELPAILVQDLRSGRRLALPAAIGAEALREAAVSLRRASLAPERP